MNIEVKTFTAVIRGHNITRDRHLALIVSEARTTRSGIIIAQTRLPAYIQSPVESISFRGVTLGNSLLIPWEFLETRGPLVIVRQPVVGICDLHTIAMSDLIADSRRIKSK